MSSKSLRGSRLSLISVSASKRLRRRHQNTAPTLGYFYGRVILRRTIPIVSAIAAIVVVLPPAAAQEICSAVAESTIIGQDPENSFLGKITNSFDADSIFNDFGKYGNDFSALSIWNEFGKFGNNFNDYSPFNENSKKPPILVKGGKVIGYLTSNKSLPSSISPIRLKALCGDIF